MRSDRNWTTAVIASAREAADGVREILLKPEGGASPFPSGAHLAVRVIIDGKTDLRY